MANDSASSGGTAKALDHTTYESMLAGPPCFAVMLPPAHDRAAISTSISPTNVVVPSVCRTMTAMPAVASSSENHWKMRTDSPASHIYRPMVKNTWTRITSEAMPGEIRPLIAT